MTIRIFIFFFIAPFLFSTITLGQVEEFDIELEAITLNGAPAIQSYTFGIYDGKWVIIGGRTDGLHDHRPPFSFLPQYDNDFVWVIDPAGNQTWSASLSALPVDQLDQLSSSNIQFQQRGNTLYLAGGYGNSTTAGNHITFPNLTAVDLPGLVAAVVAGDPVSSFFRQITDQRMAVTGGHLEYMDDQFYLVFGHRFDGRYNPHNMPSFTQTYTNEVRIFDIVDNGSTMSIANYQAWNDTANFHRRDYNLVPQILSDGTEGLIAFSGVFRPQVDLPWFNTVQISPSGYSVNNDFEQLLNQYHSACMPVFDSVSNAMHTFFFGGIGMYYYDQPGFTLYVDSLVPFVSTISQVTRFANDSMTEFALTQQMPDLYGASAEFIPAGNAPYYSNGVLKLNELPAARTLVGYIYGGILSTQPNIFMQFSGTSDATSQVFKVYLSRSGATGIDDAVTSSPFSLECYPNPLFNRELNIRFELPETRFVRMVLSDSGGKEVRVLMAEKRKAGSHQFQAEMGDLSPGIYFCTLEGGELKESRKIIIE